MQETPPSGAPFGKVALGAAVAVAAGVILAKKRREKHHPVAERAEALQQRLENLGPGELAAGVAGVWLLLRLAELRQLRRINKNLRTVRGSL